MDVDVYITETRERKEVRTRAIHKVEIRASVEKYITNRLSKTNNNNTLYL